MNENKWTTKQRDDLKPCPFCGTAAIEKARLAENSMCLPWYIMCGNPFCEMDCKTCVCAALSDAERIWQERQ